MQLYPFFFSLITVRINIRTVSLNVRAVRMKRRYGHWSYIWKSPVGHFWIIKIIIIRDKPASYISYIRY